jgi:hypothetical protein
MGETENWHWIWVWEQHLNSFYFDFVQKNVQFEMNMGLVWIFDFDCFNFLFPPLQIGILILIHFEQKILIGGRWAILFLIWTLLERRTHVMQNSWRLQKVHPNTY